MFYRLTLLTLAENNKREIALNGCPRYCFLHFEMAFFMVCTSKDNFCLKKKNCKLGEFVIVAVGIYYM